MKKILILIYFTAFCNKTIDAQCASCNILISETDTLSYIVSTGQILCIDSSANMLGKITLNGGTICNKGFLNANDLVFNSGAIYNSGNITYNKTISMPSSVSLSIDNGSVINITGDFILNGCNITNNGFINVFGNIQNNSANLNNNKVINCEMITGDAVTNSGIINNN